MGEMKDMRQLGMPADVAEGGTRVVDPGYDGPKGYGIAADAPSHEYARQIALAFMEGNMSLARGLVEQYGWHRHELAIKELVKDLHQRYCE